MSNVGSGIASGAAAGAASGAGVGTAASPGIGTAIGAAIGAIGGAIAGGVKAKQDEKNREKEVKRVEEREDNAIRRATADALLSGVDPRSSGQVPNSAGSASVAPQETQESLSDFVQAGGQVANAFQKRVDLDVDAQQIVGSNYQKFLFDADDQFMQATTERDKLLSDMATRTKVDVQDIEKNLTSIKKYKEESVNRFHEYTKTDEYNTLSHVIEKELQGKNVTLSTESVDKLYQEYCNNWAFKTGASSSNKQSNTKTSANVPGAKGSVYTPILPPAGSSGSNMAGIAAGAGRLLSRAEFGELVREVLGSLGFGNTDTQGKEHSDFVKSGVDWSSSAGKDVDSSTSYLDGKKVVNSIAKAAINRSEKMTTEEYINGITTSESGITEKDKNNYVYSMFDLNQRIDFFATLRNTDYLQYVSRYYPGVRRFLRSMRYGLLDKEESDWKHKYIPSDSYMNFEF